MAGGAIQEHVSMIVSAASVGRRRCWGFLAGNVRNGIGATPGHAGRIAVLLCAECPCTEPPAALVPLDTGAMLLATVWTIVWDWSAVSPHTKMSSAVTANHRTGATRDHVKTTATDLNAVQAPMGDTGEVASRVRPGGVTLEPARMTAMV